jgi:hypothetical protein
MTDAAETLWLIVSPASAADERLAGLLPLLSELGVDAYQARARLVGRGPALLTKGGAAQLQKIAVPLRHYHFEHWIVPPPRPRFSPMRLLAVEASHGLLIFSGQDAPLTFPRGARVLAVLADLSGALVHKNLQRLLAQNAYLGSAAPLREDELQQTILTGSPVLDLYRLSDSGEVEAAVRAFPGRFNPAGLGERASLSATGNLRALLEAARESAGAFTLNCDFGLASIPGCQPKKRGTADEDLQGNLAALGRYGWLLTSLASSGSTAQAKGAPLSAALAPAMAGGGLIGLAAVAGMAGVAGMPALDEVVLPGGGVPEPAPAPFSPPAAPVAATLPPPPAVAKESSGLLRWLSWSSAGFVLFSLPMIFNNHLAYLGFRYGVIPAFFAALFFIGGFQVLRWKRRIENTPTSRVRSLAMGVVEVHGRALRKYALVSPMTQMACVWYRLFRYRRDGRGWRLKSVVTSGSTPFLLDDGTGQVSIDPKGAMIRARTRQEGYGPRGTGLLALSSSSRADEKWVEEVIYEGTSLYVLGNAHPVKRHCSLRERTMEALRKLKGDPEAMRKYDLDGNGQICQNEWELARTDVEAQVLRESLLTQQRKGPAEAVIGKRGAAPFIIAETESEARLARGYGWTAFILFAFGLLLAVAAVVLIYQA